MCSLTHRNTQVQVLIDLHGYTLGIEHTWNQVYYTHTPTHAHTHTHTHTRARPHPRALSLSLTHSLSLTGVSDGGSTSAGTLSWPGHYCISPMSSIHWPYTLNILGP
jgi:hypothetical protein